MTVLLEKISSVFKYDTEQAHYYGLSEMLLTINIITNEVTNDCSIREYQCAIAKSVP